MVGYLNERSAVWLVDDGDDVGTNDGDDDSDAHRNNDG